MLETTLTVEWWPTERPLPYEHNPRVVTDDGHREGGHLHPRVRLAPTPGRG